MNEETSKIVDEVLQIYSSPNDVKRVQEIQCLQQQLEENCMKQRQELKNIIHELTERNKKAERNTIRTDSKEEHEKRLMMLRRELEDIQFHISNIEKHANDHKQQILDLQARMEQLQKREQQEKEEFEQKYIPRHKRTMNLYNYIVPIQWDNQGDGVKGCIVKESKITPFHFKNQSDFDICNSIWEIL